MELRQAALISLLNGGSKQDYAALAAQLTLTEALAEIEQHFGCDRILKVWDTDITVPYYTQSEWGYRLYHSAEDAVHMAVNFNGVFHPDGYYVQPKVVMEQIQEIEARTVLELGCGKGFNSRFLAPQLPSVQFTGIDLTPLHIKIARQKAQGIPNLVFQAGDFSQLDFPEQSFDIVFAVESLCHAQQPEIPLAEILRVLRPGGKLIIFDGYRQASLEKYSKELQAASQLTESSMAVQHGFTELNNWIELAQSVGFHMELQEDLSSAIQPTLRKLQQLALRFFRTSSWRINLLIYFLPEYLTNNSVAGLLMPFVLQTPGGSLGYYQLILKR